MGLGWDQIQNLGSKGLASEVMVVWMGQTSRNFDTIILPAFSTSNQPVSQTRVFGNNR